MQADPIRAPARAQDLALRHRVKDYRAGDLERRYAAVGLEEDFFINYGFLPRAVQALMHPRTVNWDWSATRKKQAQSLLAFVRERGPVHPREVDAHFSHGTTRNYWGGSSNTTTHLLDALHYQGLLRVARREGGVRVYETFAHPSGPAKVEERHAQIDALVDVVVGTYAPLPGPSLSGLVSRLRFGVPQWHGELKSALQRAQQRLSHARAADVDWYWPADERVRHESALPDTVRLLAPFDPVVWDRRRFELFWGWAYRFEAYTPPAKRRLGYYALPMLWRGRVIGWGNLSVNDGALQPTFGYVASQAPRDRTFRRELDEEIDRLHVFLTARPSRTRSAAAAG